MGAEWGPLTNPGKADRRQWRDGMRESGISVLFKGDCCIHLCPPSRRLSGVVNGTD